MPLSQTVEGLVYKGICLRCSTVEDAKHMPKPSNSTSTIGRLRTSMTKKSRQSNDPSSINSSINTSNLHASVGSDSLNSNSLTYEGAMVAQVELDNSETRRALDSSDRRKAVDSSDRRREEKQIPRSMSSDSSSSSSESSESSSERRRRRRKKKHKRKNHKKDKHHDRHHSHKDRDDNHHYIGNPQHHVEDTEVVRDNIVPKVPKKIVRDDDDMSIMSEITLDVNFDSGPLRIQRHHQSAGGGAGGALPLSDKMGDIEEEDEYESFDYYDGTGSGNTPKSELSTAIEPDTKGNNRFETLYERKIADANAATARRYSAQPAPSNSMRLEKDTGSTSGGDSRGGSIDKSQDDLRRSAPPLETFSGKESTDKPHVKHRTSAPLTLYERKIAEANVANSRRYSAQPAPTKSLSGVKKETGSTNSSDSHGGSIDKSQGELDTSVSTRFETLLERKSAENKAATSRRYSPSKTREEKEASKNGTNESASGMFEDRLKKKLSTIQPARQNESATPIRGHKGVKNEIESTNSSDSHGGSIDKSQGELDTSVSTRFERLLERKSAENKAATSRRYSPSKTREEKEASKNGTKESASGMFEDRLKKKLSTIQPARQNESATPVVKKEKSQFDVLYQQLTAEIDVPVEAKEKKSVGSTNSAGKSLVQSQFGTMYDRKIAEADFASSRKYSANKNATMTKESSQTMRLPEKEKSRSKVQTQSVGNVENFLGILDFLKNNLSDSPSSVAPALVKLRDSLPMEHDIAAYTKLVQSDGKWKSSFSKILIMVMMKHTRNEGIQLEALRSVWAIVALSPRYVSEFASHPEGIDLAMKSMNVHHQSAAIQECGSGLIACLAGIQKFAIRLIRGDSVIQQLTDTLTFPCRTGSVQTEVLRALFRLSSASISSSSAGCFRDTMRSCAIRRYRGKGAVSTIELDVIFDAMVLYPENLSMQIWGCRLIWNIFTPASCDATEDELHALSDFVSNGVNYLRATVQKNQECLALCESIISLLSKISCFEGSMLTEVESCTKTVIEVMIAHPNSSIIAHQGCRCLYNICARKLTAPLARSVVGSCNGVEAVISCMARFSQNLQVQGEACGALAAISVASVPNKQAVVELGGIQRILDAFNSYLISPYDDFSLTTKIRACTALSALAADPNSMEALIKAGVMSSLENVVFETNDEEAVPDVLFQPIQKLLDLESGVHDDISTPEIHIDSSEAEYCEWLTYQFHNISNANTMENPNMQLRSIITCAMMKFPSCIDIQETGCKILACIYSNGDDQSLEQVNAIDVEMIVKSMNKNAASTSVMAAACSALKNFCVAWLTMSQYDPKGLKDDVLPKSAVEVINSLETCGGDPQVQMEAAGALWALCNIKVDFSMSRAANLLIRAVGCFPTDFQLQRNCFGALWSFFRVIGSATEVTDDFIDSALRFLNEFDEEEETAEIVVNIIMIITRSGYQSILASINNETLIETIVGCMFKYTESSSIQGAVCIIISNITSNISMDNSIRTDICSLGGTSRIVDFLDKFRQDRPFVCKALTSLGVIVSGADVEVIRGNKTISCILNAMESYASDVYLQIKGTGALFCLAAMDDDFKSEIVELGGANMIIGSMCRFISSEKMQEKGLETLWSLLIPWELKLKLGPLAVNPILHGMSAYLTSQKVCENGLGALKAISTHPSSKPILLESDAFDLIIACMWLHENPDLQHMATGTLINISVNLDTNQVLVMNANDLDVIIHAMQMHQDHKGVQENLLILLKNFSFSPTNCAILREQRGSLSVLIRSAASRFSDSFSGRVDRLLTILA